MVYRSKIFITLAFFFSGLLIFQKADLRAAETPTIKPGDKVGIQFTCRFPNGEIAASTSTAVAADSSLRKSVVFRPKPGNDTVEVTAGGKARPVGFSLTFEEEIVVRILAALPGMTPAETHVLKIGEEKPEPGHLLELSRISRYPKELKMSRDHYKALTWKEAEVGA